MSNPHKKIKADFESIVRLYVNDKQENKRKIAKQQPAMNLLDLNVDCVFEIFERAEVMDLANLSRTSEFMKTIAFDIFQRKYKSLKMIYSDIVSEEQAVKAKLLFKTFGSLIVELDVQFQPYNNKEDYKTADILHAIMTHCTSIKSLKLASFDIPDDEFWFIRMRKLFARLEKLHLHHVFFGYEYYGPLVYDTTPNGNDINVFDNCTSLRELTLYESYYFYDTIFGNLFPKLQHFVIDHPQSCRTNGTSAFILRHPHLKTFSLNCEYRHIPVAAANLLDLETFGFQFDYASPTKTSVESLSKFRNLKELTCVGVGLEDNMSRLLKTLPKLANTLEVLDLQYGRGNRDFVEVVNSLPKLKVVRLTDISINDISHDDLKDLLRPTVIFE